MSLFVNVLGFITNLFLLYVILYVDKRVQGERSAWAKERADLISRIQAGSYGEYKAMEIKSVKAQVEAVPNHIEQL